MSRPDRRDRWRAHRRVTIAVVAVVFVCATLYAWRTDAVSPRAIRDWLDSLGPWAPAVFVSAFAVGALIGLPGIAFVVGARLAFGPYLGFALGYGGGMLAVLTPFVAARSLRAGAEPWRPRNRWIERTLALVETRPVRAVILLRLAFWFNLPLTYALAVAPIRARDYAVGCAIALVPVVTAANLATGWFA
jgi:uncharacterized membrane protein YdjX (TVP38/TMEM64 family)